MKKWWDECINSKWCHEHNLLNPTPHRADGTQPCGKATIQNYKMVFKPWEHYGWGKFTKKAAQKGNTRKLTRQDKQPS